MRSVLILALTISLAAQDHRIDVQTRLVLVPATVTDTKGHAIDGLEASDFLLLDNGQPRKAAVDSFATGVAPIALVIAVQSSGISSAVLAKVRKIGAMIQPLITGERGCAALVSFDRRIDWLQECTNDPDALARAFYRLKPGEPKSARMLDAIHDSVEHLRNRQNVRRILLLISESRDRGSETALETTALETQSAGVTVYAATYSAFKTGFTAKSPDYEAGPTPPESPSPSKGPMTPHGEAPMPPTAQRGDILGAFGELARLGKTKTTEVLANSTGGTAFPFTRQRGLEDAIEKLGAELHTQYVLSFPPDATTPGYHHLEVRVTRAGEYRVRARPGYWSTSAQ